MRANLFCGAPRFRGKSERMISHRKGLSRRPGARPPGLRAAAISCVGSRGEHVFEALGERIQGVFKELRGEGHLTEYHLDTALRQIRLSLLEADVALPVVRDFVARVREKAIGAKVLQKLSPAQEV